MKKTNKVNKKQIVTLGKVSISTLGGGGDLYEVAFKSQPWPRKI